MLRNLPRFGPVLLIVVHAALLVWSARTNSVTVDEFAHVPAGLAYWRHADFSIYDLSPPLVRLVAAAPVAVGGAVVPPVAEVDGLPVKDRHWAYGREFARANSRDYHHWIFLARLALVPVSCLGAYLVWRWACDLYGATAAAVACALYCLSPTVLAHASLATTDVGTAVAMLAAAYAWWRCCREPGWARAVLPVALVAVAQLCKFTALLLWPALLLVAIVEFGRLGRKQRRRVVAAYCLTFPCALLVINAGYLFQGTGARLGAYEFHSSMMLAVQKAVPSLPVPLPHAYVEGFDQQKWESEGLHQGYLLGETYDGTRWAYYPVSLAVKTPTALLVLAPLALLIRRPRREEWPLVVTAGTFLLGMAVLARMNIGIRYLLPAYPLMHVLLARLWADRADGSGGASPSRAWVRVVWGLLALGVVEPLLAGPDFLSFTNVLTLGPRNGWRVVNDSNYDWGQDLIRLRSWMAENGVGSVQLGYFGRADPVLYGVNYSPINRPSGDEYIVVSTFYLVGLAHRTPSLAGPTPFTQIPFHAELARRKPRAVVGRTLYVYDRATVAEAMAEYRAMHATE